MLSIAATKLSDLLKPTTRGETVNVHVVQPVSEPQPDFSAMKRLIEAGGAIREQDSRKNEREN